MFTFFSRLAQAYVWTKTKRFCQSCSLEVLVLTHENEGISTLVPDVGDPVVVEAHRAGRHGHDLGVEAGDVGELLRGEEILARVQGRHPDKRLWQSDSVMTCYTRVTNGITHLISQTTGGRP